jgi:hypothetical protein
MYSGSIRFRAVRAAVAVALGLAVSGAYAATKLELRGGAEHSDNITRSNTDEQSDTIATAGVTLAVDTNRPRLDAAIVADLNYRDYLDDTFDSEVVGGLSGSVDYAFIENRFVWAVEDNYGQVSNNRQVADNPGNRQDFNLFSTGPDITLPLGDRMNMRLNGRWSDVYYEDAAQDAERVNGSLALERRIAPTTTVSLIASTAETNYDLDVIPDATIDEGFLRYDSSGARTTLSVDAGYTQTKQADETTGGGLLRLTLTRKITSRSTLSLNLGSVFADAADNFRLAQTAPGAVVGNESDTVIATDVMRTTYAYLAFGTQRERTSFDLSVNASRERHEAQPLLDRDLEGLYGSVSRRITPRVDIRLNAGYTQEDFINGLAFDEWSVGAGLNWKLTQRFGVRLDVAHYTGNGDNNARDYDENRGYLGVTYALGR